MWAIFLFKFSHVNYILCIQSYFEWIRAFNIFFWI
jgi:hypothetical protein